MTEIQRSDVTFLEWAEEGVEVPIQIFAFTFNCSTCLLRHYYLVVQESALLVNFLKSIATYDSLIMGKGICYQVKRWVLRQGLELKNLRVNFEINFRHLRVLSENMENALVIDFTSGKCKSCDDADPWLLIKRQEEKLKKLARLVCQSIKELVPAHGTWEY